MYVYKITLLQYLKFLSDGFSAAYLITLIGAIALPGHHFSDGGMVPVINSLNCTGKEARLQDCPMGNQSNEMCSQFNEAGLICQGNYVIMPADQITLDHNNVCLEPDNKC